MKNIRYFLILLLLSNVSHVLNSEQSCQCYCSDKCGPREKRPGIDRPKYNSEHNKCFCLPRDEGNFDKKTHKEFGGKTCKEKEKDNPTILQPNCCELEKNN